ncbi:MAG: hypothetical protein QOE98_2020 [Gaiellaceae bacterium]|nr:hypothetical protein [Gaiellaceae bacterium]
MLFALLRPGKMISLAILVAIVGGGWWAWGRLHRSEPASRSAALGAVRDAKGNASGLPRAGVYQYSSGGDERIGFGPLSVGRKLPKDALLVVTPSPNSRYLDLWVSGDHTEGWRVQTSASGTKGIARTIEVGTFGYTRTVTGNAVPPVMLRPARLRRGLKWRSVYKVGAIVFHRESSVLARQTLTIGGRAVRTWVIQTKETVTGALHGDETRKEWWSPSLGVDVRVEWHRNLDGTIVNILSDTLEMKSLDPLR